MMQKVVCLNKMVGETPLEAIEKFRASNPEYKNEKLAYAGRLDPMAEGLLLVLVGSECKKRKNYERLPKTYEFEVLFGISTDTYDILGLLERGSTRLRLNNSRINPGSTSPEAKFIESFIGKFNQPYPPYSSPRVNGKPLFYWAREGKLSQIKIPTKRVEIYSLKHILTRFLKTQDLYTIIVNRISKTSGNFRQKEILKTWNQFFKDHPSPTSTKDDPYLVAKFQITCSSGTYVRSLAHEMGQKTKTGAIAFSIKRTQIGSYFLIE